MSLVKFAAAAAVCGLAACAPQGPGSGNPQMVGNTLTGAAPVSGTGSSVVETRSYVGDAKGASGCPDVRYTVKAEPPGSTSILGGAWWSDFSGFSVVRGTLVNGVLNATVTPIADGGKGPAGVVPGSVTSAGNAWTMKGEGCSNVSGGVTPYQIPDGGHR